VIDAYGLREGDLDTSSLYRVGTGSRDVFKRRFEAKSLQETVVALWFDQSGSMVESTYIGNHKYMSRLQAAQMATIVFAQALDAINIPFEVVGYSTGDAHIGVGRYYNAKPAERLLYARWGNLLLTKYKGYDERWQTVAPRIMAARAHDNTYDGECVKLACQRLIRQKQTRKVLFIMNDGDPCPNVLAKTDTHQSYLKEVVDSMSDVEIVAIGIMTDAVKAYYPRYVVVNSVEELPKVMAQQLGAVLLGQ
jgi:cobalamin biosynthesis protein CobT